jgi:hypothetical protein
MAKASLTLPTGTLVHIEGTPDEIRQLLQFYGGDRTPERKSRAAKKTPSGASARKASRTLNRSTKTESERDPVDITGIVNAAKACDEAEKIEKRILDRTSQIDRTLLALYVVHEHFEGGFGLSSGDVSRVTNELRVPVSTANASTTLSGAASKYVIGDKVRRPGQAVRYKLSRRGHQYMKGVINGKQDEGAA